MVLNTRLFCLVILLLLGIPLIAEDHGGGSPSDDAETVDTVVPSADIAAEDRREQLNLLGQTDTEAGESRRNENVQFNLIDNNALKELNLRLGPTASLYDEFTPDKRYFGSELGTAPSDAIHLVAVPNPGARPHGQFYYGHLNSAFTARAFFQVGDVQPARENDYGFTLTTPVRQGTNFTVNGGQTKIRGQVNGNVLVPLPEERIPLVTDPARREVVERIISAYPNQLPNRADIAERMLNTNSPQEIDNDLLDGRIDQQFGQRDELFLRYEYLAQRVRAFQFVKGQNPDTQTRSHLARATWTRAWSPNAVSDLTLGFNRVGSLLTPEDDFIGFRASISGTLEALGPGNSIPIDRAQNDYQWAGKVSVVRGRHQLYWGGGAMRRQLNGIESDAHLAHVRFSNNFGNDAMTNLRLGLPSAYFAGVGNVHRGFRFWYGHGFIGDKWQVNPRFTATLGLRWEGQTQPIEVDGLNEFPYDGDFNNFGPSAGFAYRLSDRWGVLRAGYGMHYGEIFAVTAQQIRFNAPLNFKLVIQDPDLLDPLAGIGDTPPPGTRTVLYDFVSDLDTPYSHQYNLTWELAPAQALRLQVGYVGSRSVKLLHHWYSNRGHPADGIPHETGTIDQRRADDRYVDVRRVYNGSRGYFDAAKVTALIPRWKGLSGEVSYWFSKSIDLGASYTNTAQGLDSFGNSSQSEWEVHRDLKGRSRFDQPHAFLARGGYELPGVRGRRWLGLFFSNWSVSGVVLLKSGTPFSLSTGSDAPGFGNVDGINSDRPNVVDPSVLGRTIGHPDTSQALLPPEAFTFIELGEQAGNIGRNTFRRGPIRNVNLSLAKTWRLQNEKELILRAESINFLNTPQFAEPGDRLTDPNFGAITNTLNEGRTFRFQLRFGF